MGVVLRVSSRRVWSPSSICTIMWVCVAIPLRRCMKFSAVRSAVRIAPDAPSTIINTSPFATSSPSFFSLVMVMGMRVW